MIKKTKRVLVNYGGWYLFLIIPIIGTIIFNIYPLIKTVIQSLSNSQMTFIGITNYSIIFGDKSFHKALVNTFYMGALGLVMNVPFAFIVAFLLNSIRKGRRFFQSIFLLPMIISYVALVGIFKLIFGADPNSIANSLLRLFGVEPLTWFNNLVIVRPLAVFMAVWKGIGFNIIILYAGMQAIPIEHFEVADIEGASVLQKIRYVVLPGVRNTLIVVWVITCIAVFKRFTDVFALGGEYAQPAEYVLTIMFYIYQKSFSQLFYKDVGAAAAASIVLFVIIMVVSVINYLSRETRENRRGERND